MLKDPAPDVLVLELTESTVKIRVRWWMAPPRRIDDMRSRDKVICAIKKKLVENGIDLPYLTGQILFHIMSGRATAIFVGEGSPTIPANN